MNKYVTAVDSMIKLATNLKPKNPVDTGHSTKKTLEMIKVLEIGIQKQLIAYECLQAAVLLSKDNKKISANMEIFLEEKIKELAGV